jgi:hypothetical protein
METMDDKIKRFEVVTNEARQLSKSDQPDRAKINSLLMERNRLKREIDSELKEMGRTSTHVKVIIN